MKATPSRTLALLVLFSAAGLSSRLSASVKGSQSARYACPRCSGHAKHQVRAAHSKVPPFWRPCRLLEPRKTQREPHSAGKPKCQLRRHRLQSPWCHRARAKQEKPAPSAGLTSSSAPITQERFFLTAAADQVAVKAAKLAVLVHPLGAPLAWKHRLVSLVLLAPAASLQVLTAGAWLATLLGLGTFRRCGWDPMRSHTPRPIPMVCRQVLPPLRLLLLCLVLHLFLPQPNS